jgi:hypothetical protein
MSIFWKLTILGVMGLILIGTFFSPIIIAIITSNWWFLLLFAVSWTPTWGEVLIFAVIISIID